MKEIATSRRRWFDRKRLMGRRGRPGHRVRLPDGREARCPCGSPASTCASSSSPRGQAFGSSGAIAWATGTRWGGAGAVLLNVFLAVVLFAGVDKRTGRSRPGPAFWYSSPSSRSRPFLGVASSPRGSECLNVGAMTFVARGVPQLVETPAIALTYGLALCCVTTLLGVVATANAYGAIEKVVQRERRAVAAEARASESEARYRLITDSMSDLVALLDDAGRFLYASPSFERSAASTRRPCCAASASISSTPTTGGPRARPSRGRSPRGPREAPSAARGGTGRSAGSSGSSHGASKLGSEGRRRSRARRDWMARPRGSAGAGAEDDAPGRIRRRV